MSHEQAVATNLTPEQEAFSRLEDGMRELEGRFAELKDAFGSNDPELADQIIALSCVLLERQEPGHEAEALLIDEVDVATFTGPDTELGLYGFRWLDVYCSNGKVQTSFQKLATPLRRGMNEDTVTDSVDETFMDENHLDGNIFTLSLFPGRGLLVQEVPATLYADITPNAVNELAEASRILGMINSADVRPKIRS